MMLRHGIYVIFNPDKMYVPAILPAKYPHANGYTRTASDNESAAFLDYSNYFSYLWSSMADFG